MCVFVWLLVRRQLNCNGGTTSADRWRRFSGFEFKRLNPSDNRQPTQGESSQRAGCPNKTGTPPLLHKPTNNTLTPQHKTTQHSECIVESLCICHSLCHNCLPKCLMRMTSRCLMSLRGPRSLRTKVSFLICCSVVGWCAPTQHSTHNLVYLPLTCLPSVLFHTHAPTPHATLYTPHCPTHVAGGPSSTATTTVTMKRKFEEEPYVSTPMCACGVGPCNINKDVQGRIFFACPDDVSSRSAVVGRWCLCLSCCQLCLHHFARSLALCYFAALHAALAPSQALIC